MNNEITPLQSIEKPPITLSAQDLESLKSLPSNSSLSPLQEINEEDVQALLRNIRQFPQAFVKTATQGSTGAGSTGSVGNIGNSIDPTNDVPIPGRVTQAYGAPVNYEASGQHGGIDIAVALGTPIPDNHGGTVLRTEDNSGGYGKSVLISGADGIIRRYSHLSEFNVQEGAKIPANTVIGLSGSSGHSSGPHLDYREYAGSN